MQALAQVDDDDAAGRCLGEQRQHGRVLRRIADPERQQDQRLHRLLQDVGDHLTGDPRIEGHHADRLGGDVVQHQRPLGGHTQLARFQRDGDPGIEQRRIVGGVEGVEAVGVHLLAAVAAIELVVEEQRHLVDRVVGRDIEGVEQVLLTVGAQLGQRDLGAGDDDRLVQIFQHEGERRGGERHGVGAMQDHKTIVFLVVVANILGDTLPIRRGHVGGVDEGGIFVDMVIRHLGAVELGHPRQTVFHKARHRHVAVIGTLHPNGAACVGNVDRLLHTLSS